MEQLIVTGANGLIGSSFCKTLRDTYQLITLDVSDPERPVDITNREAVFNAVRQSDATFIVHFAAFTNVTAAWEQTDDTSGPAYQINVVGTKHLVDACNETGKHIIAVSTAYVFDGEKADQYTENDATNPIEWYGKTKALAEEYIQQQAKNWTIFRIDQPFKAETFSKLDLAHKIAADLQADSLFPQFEDHFFGPTWIPDFVKTISWSIQNKKAGLYHATSGETWNNYDFAKEIARLLGKDTAVQASSLMDYLKSNNRPYQKNTALNCDKLFAEIDFQYTTVRDALKTVNFSL